MRRTCTALAAACALVSAGRTTFAHEVVFGAQTSAGYDSNVFSSDEDKQDDVLFRVGPIIRLRHPVGDLTYDFYYAPLYEFYRAFDELNDWEHTATGRLGWQIGPRTKLELADQFYLTNSSRRAQELQATDPTLGVAPVPDAVFGTDRFLNNTVSLSGSHLFTERLSLSAAVSNILYRPDRENSTDTTSTTGTATMLYALTPRARIGGGGGVTWQMYEGPTVVGGESETFYYQVYGRVEYDVSPTWQISLQAGPAYVDPETVESPTQAVLNRYPLFLRAGQDGLPNTSDDETFLLDLTTCDTREGVVVASGCTAIAPPIETINEAFAQALRNSFVLAPLQNVQQGENSSVTYFADASITKSWETVDASLSFRRSAGTASGLGTASTDTTVRGAVVWRPDQKWRFTLSSFYTMKEAEGDARENLPIVGSILDGPTGAIEETIGVLSIFFNPQFANSARTTGARQFTFTNQSKLTTYSIGLYSEHRFTKNFTAFNRIFYTYHVSEFDGAFESKVSYDSTRIDLGVRYEFDPIHFF
jgi:hypothetical protein